MKNKSLVLVALLALVFSLPMFAQSVTLASTTTTAAIAATDKSICLTSATGVIVPGVGTTGSTLYFDGETSVVRSVTPASALCFNITRSNRPVGHAAGVTVYIGRGDQFQAYNPMGTCSVGAMAVRPWINVRDSVISDCQNGVWVPQVYTPKPVMVVSKLPTCNASLAGATAAVTDALTPVALSPVTGGGAVFVTLYCNATNWVVQ